LGAPLKKGGSSLTKAINFTKLSKKNNTCVFFTLLIKGANMNPIRFLVEISVNFFSVFTCSFIISNAFLMPPTGSMESPRNYTCYTYWKEKNTLIF